MPHTLAKLEGRRRVSHALHLRVYVRGLERIPIIRDGGECLSLALCARRVRTPAEAPGRLPHKPDPGARGKPVDGPAGHLATLPPKPINPALPYLIRQGFNYLPGKSRWPLQQSICHNNSRQVLRETPNHWLFRLMIVSQAGIPDYPAFYRVALKSCIS